MHIDTSVLAFSLYTLVVIVYFFYHAFRGHGAFVGTTLLYFVGITISSAFLIYGSAYSVNSYVAQWSHDGVFSQFPLLISGGGPGRDTLPRTDPSYWPLLVGGLAFFVTFPQAVVRAHRKHLAGHKSPDDVMKATLRAYSGLRRLIFLLFGKALPVLLGTAYSVGEWVFVLLALSSLISPYPTHNIFLFLIGCALVVWLAGKGIFVGAAKAFVSHQ